jgi:hypothetical protein
MRKPINLLVVVIILVIGAGLIFPLILKVRNASARADCANNLKQIGLALWNFHDTFNRFPMATVRNSDLPPEKRLSWYVDLSPFVEQWFMDFDNEKPWDSEENLKPKCHGVEGPLVDLDVVRYHFCKANPNQTHEVPNVTHYVGIAGLGKDAAELAPKYPGVGVFGYDRKTKLADITDGTSTTMIVAETAWKNGPWTAGGFPTVRGLEANGMSYLGRDGQFSSRHRFGSGFFFTGEYATNILFMDGSVRSFGESVDPRVFEAMATIAGGETVDLAGESLSPAWRPVNVAEREADY